MNSSAQRTFPLLRRHPVLLGTPILGVAAFNFLIWKITEDFNNHFFPLPRLDTRFVHAAGHAALPLLLFRLRTSVIRMGIHLSTQIGQYMLEAFAVALTVVLVMQLSRNEADTFSSAIGRLRRTPGLLRTLFWFCLMFLSIGIATAAALLPIALILVPHSKVHGPHPPIHIPVLAIAIVTAVWIAIVAYFVMPLFLDLVLRVQQRTFSDDSVRKQIEVRARYYAWIAIAATSISGLFVRSAQLSLAKTFPMNRLAMHNLTQLTSDLFTEIPKVCFVVAVALLVMHAEEPVTNRETT